MKKYRRRKAKTTYPDRHNFKLESGANVIYNVSPGTVIAAGSSVYIGKFSSQRTNFQQFGGVFSLNLDNALATLPYLSSNFDRYKINAIKIRVIPENNFAAVAGAGTLPTMKVCYDFDDNNIPSVGDIEVRRGKTHLLNKPFTITLTPKINHLIYQSGTVSAQSPQKAPWINMNALLVPHYGVKFMIRDWYSNATTLNDLQLRFQITYMVSVKEQVAVNRAPSLIEEEDTQPTLVEDLSQNEVPSLYNPERE